MKKLFLILLLVVSLGFALPSDASAKGHKSYHRASRSSRASGKTVHVRTYTKKNGTVVHSHTRRPPRR
jgi:hypothetical protein